MHIQNTVMAGVTALSLIAFTASHAAAQSAPKFVGLGDSIGEGVQSGDANEMTQPFSFLNLMAWRMGVKWVT